jgi:hypothetical protein
VQKVFHSNLPCGPLPPLPIARCKNINHPIVGDALMKLKRGGPPFSILRTCYRLKVLVMLRREHKVSILKHVVTIGESSSRLGILLGSPSLSLLDILLVTGEGSGT